MIGRMVAMEKLPSVIPMVIGEVWYCILNNIFLFEGGAQVKEACVITNICAVLEAITEAIIHAGHERSDLFSTELEDEHKLRGREEGIETGRCES